MWWADSKGVQSAQSANQKNDKKHTESILRLGASGPNTTVFDLHGRSWQDDVDDILAARQPIR